MIILIILAILLISILVMYNKLVNLRNKVSQAKSGIDVYLKQRFDLIPNLVECVKAYSKHESDILIEVTNLREAYVKNNEDLKNSENLNNKVNKLIAIAESYPQLKASEQYLNLQNTLSKLESQLQAARRIYNNEVTKYNTKIEVVPSNLIAKIFGFKHADLFEIEEYQKENVNINLGV